MMILATMLVRLVLAAVFGVAGIAKLRSRDATRVMLVAFDVPIGLTGAVAILLPFAELALAVGLLIPAGAWVAGIAALSLLLLFTAVMLWQLAQGKRPACNCFGQAHAEPIGAMSVARNLAFALLAGVIVVAGPSAAGRITLAGLSPLVATALAFAVVCTAFLGTITVLLVKLLKRHDQLLAKIAEVSPAKAPKPPRGLPVGSKAPGFVLKNTRGEQVSLEMLTASGRPVILLFTSPRCLPCRSLEPEIAIWEKDNAARLNIVRISDAPAQQEDAQVLIEVKRAVSEAYQCWGTPAAVLVRTDGTIGSAMAQGAEAIRTLMANNTQQIDRQPPNHAVTI